MTALHTYKGYKISVRESQTPPVAVFHPLYPKAPALYKATSLDQGMRWVDAYIKGEAWANDLAVGQARNAAEG